MDDNNTQQPLPQEQPKITPSSSHRLKPLLTGISAIALIGLGLLGGYFLFSPKTGMYYPKTTPPTPTTITEQSPTYSVSPSPGIDSWETYTSVQLQDISLKPYTVSYPDTWTKSVKRDNSSDTLSLVKEKHMITIYQGAFGGGGCIFEGDVPEGPYTDLRGIPYTEIDSSLGRLRRYEQDMSQLDPSLASFQFCLDKNGIYQSPTTIGKISYMVPRNYNSALINEMDQIIATLSEIK